MKTTFSTLIVIIETVIICGIFVLPYVDEDIGEGVMLTLTYVAVGLALALVVVLIFERLKEKKEEKKDDISNY